MGKFFYCHYERCLDGRQPVDQIAQELGGKKLCKTCYNRGLRLKRGIIVVKVK